MTENTKEISVFNYRDVRKYLEEKLQSLEIKGIKSRIAQILKVQPAFITRVFQEYAQFSLEHLSLLNGFFGHNKDESEYLLFLAQWERAGVRELKEFFDQKLNEIIQRRSQIKERMTERKENSLEDQVIYYSSWYYSAIHILSTVPTLQTKGAMCKHLNIRPEDFSFYLEFLTTRGFITEENGKLKNGKTKLHLPRESPMISKLHSNWRIQAIESLNKYRSTDIHFSGIYTLSKEDKEKLQLLFVDFIEKADKLIRPSPEEIGCVLCMDLFEI